MESAIPKGEGEIMNAPNDNFDSPDVSALQTAWQAFDEIAHLKPLDSEADYRHAMSLLELIWDVVGDQERHPLGSLLGLLGRMISDYEKVHYSLGRSEPHELLAFLIEQGARTPADFAGILEPAELEEILSGRRAIDEKTAIKLAAFFKVTPQIFLRQE